MTYKCDLKKYWKRGFFVLFDASGSSFEGFSSSPYGSRRSSDFLVSFEASGSCPDTSCSTSEL